MDKKDGNIHIMDIGRGLRMVGLLSVCFDRSGMREKLNHILFLKLGIRVVMPCLLVPRPVTLSCL